LVDPTDGVYGSIQAIASRDGVERGAPICDCGVIRKAIDTVKQRTRAMSERVEDCGGFGR